MQEQTTQAMAQPMMHVPNTSTMTLGQWVGTLLLMLIPFVNIILLLVWAFSSGTNINKQNWAKAQLLIILISLVLFIMFWGAIFGIISSIF